MCLGNVFDERPLLIFIEKLQWVFRCRIEKLQLGLRLLYAQMPFSQYPRPLFPLNKMHLLQHTVGRVCHFSLLEPPALRPNMRFVPIKQLQHQDIQALHRSRERLIREKVMLINQIRAILLEYGVLTP